MTSTRRENSLSCHNTNVFVDGLLPRQVKIFRWQVSELASHVNLGEMVPDTEQYLPEAQTGSPAFWGGHCNMGSSPFHHTLVPGELQRWIEAVIQEGAD